VSSEVRKPFLRPAVCCRPARARCPTAPAATRSAGRASRSARSGRTTCARRARRRGWRRSPARPRPPEPASVWMARASRRVKGSRSRRPLRVSSRGMEAIVAVAAVRDRSRTRGSSARKTGSAKHGHVAGTGARWDARQQDTRARTARWTTSDRTQQRVPGPWAGSAANGTSERSVGDDQDRGASSARAAGPSSRRPSDARSAGQDGAATTARRPQSVGEGARSRAASGSTCQLERRPRHHPQEAAPLAERVVQEDRCRRPAGPPARREARAARAD
jgi:hypothetical protein